MTMEQNYSKSLCANIARLRRQSGMTQEVLAERLGVTYQAVSKWENELSCPDISLLPLIANIFGVSVDALMGVTPIKEEAPASVEVPEGAECIEAALRSAEEALKSAQEDLAAAEAAGSIENTVRAAEAFAEAAARKAEAFEKQAEQAAEKAEAFEKQTENSEDIPKVKAKVVGSDIDLNEVAETVGRVVEQAVEGAMRAAKDMGHVAKDVGHNVKETVKNMDFSWAKELGRNVKNSAVHVVNSMTGAEEIPIATLEGLPWEDDETIHVVAIRGHRLVKIARKEAEKYTVDFGSARIGDIDSDFSVTCVNVEGDIKAGVNVNCGSVAGDVNAGATINCGEVAGDVKAGATINCGGVAGDVRAGAKVNCQGDIHGDVGASGGIACGNVGGDVTCRGGSVTCKNVEGDIVAQTVHRN